VKYQSIIENSNSLIGAVKEKYREFIRTEKSERPENALQSLCQYLLLTCGKEPILLLDEYATPLTETFGKNFFA
jgi:hypothetical protein